MTVPSRCVASIVLSVGSLCAGQSRADAGKRGYSGTPFNPAVARLPANYQGNNADTLYQLIEKREKSRTKGEFETTEQYRARIERQDRQPLAGSLQVTSLLAFKLADVKFHYDADRQVMQLYVPAAFAVDELDQIDNSKLALKLHESVSSRSYAASNAFGATAVVKERDVKSTEIGVVNAGDFDFRTIKIAEGKTPEVKFGAEPGIEKYDQKIGDGLVIPNDQPETTEDRDAPSECYAGCFYGELHLAPGQARRLKQSARALVIGSLADRAASKGASSGDATIENPTAYFEQVRYINLEVSEIWIYGPETGTVFVKIQPQ
jgi:hypothetical protein